MLDRLCSRYMAMGMSYCEFWHGDMAQWKFVREAWQHRIKHENEMLWLQGAYIFNAITVALNNFSRAKGKSPESYMEEPLRITQMTDEEKEAEKQKQVTAFRNALDSLGKHFEAKHKREKDAAQK